MPEIVCTLARRSPPNANSGDLVNERIISISPINKSLAFLTQCSGVCPVCICLGGRDLGAFARWLSQSQIARLDFALIFEGRSEQQMRLFGYRDFDRDAQCVWTMREIVTQQTRQCPARLPVKELLNERQPFPQFFVSRFAADG
jgi:hypothetical protein